MNEDKPRKLVYVEKHSEPSQIWDHANDVWYECPECGRRYAWLDRSYGSRGRPARYCLGCGNYLSWAKLDYENYRESDRTFAEDMTFWKFLQDPRYGHTWEDEVSMTYSHSEVDILKGCLRLMQGMVDEFQEYCEFMDWKPDPEYEDQKFSISIPYAEIVRILFLEHTSHSGGTSTGMKCRNLGIKDHSVTFEFEEDEEEEE